MHIGDGSVIRGPANIVGPVIIGDNVIVEAYTEIRDGTFIGSRAAIGGQCSVRGSMCMNFVRIEPGAVLTNCVLGYGVQVGARAVLGTSHHLSPLGNHPSPQRRTGPLIGDHVVIGALSVVADEAIIGASSEISFGSLVKGTHGSNSLIDATGRD